MLNFCLSNDGPNKSPLKDLANNGILNGFTDDTLLTGPPEIVFPILKHKARLAEVGLELSLTKTKYWIDERYKTDEYHNIREEVGVSEGVISSNDGSEVYGLKTCRIPLGDNTFVEEWLR